MRNYLTGALALAAIGLLLTPSDAAAQRCNIPICFEQGGARQTIGNTGSLDVESGGDIDIESGGTLTISSGATFTNTGTTIFAADLTLDDGVTDSPSLVLKDATNETATLLKTDGDFTTFTFVAADGLQITTGNLKVGNGSPQTAQDGEDFYVEGLSEFGNTVTLDDGTTDSPALILQDANNETSIFIKKDSGYLEITTLAADGVNIVTGNLKIGNGTPTVTPGGEDLYVEGDTEMDGSLTVDVDITVTTDPTGGDAGARSEIIGLPKLRMVSYGTGTNGSTETIALFSDTPASQCAAINQTAANDAAVYRSGTNSLKITFASTPSAGDGADCTFAGGADNFEANESIGFWFMTDTALNAGDVYLELDDNNASPDTTYDLPAVSTTNQWTWIELDISACGGGDCDVVDAAKLIIDAGGASTLSAGGNIWFDLMYKWDANDEDAIGQNIVQDGVLGVMQMITATANDRTPLLMVHDTDYLVHYDSGGNDFLVWMSDQSGKSLWGMVAIQ